MRTNNSGLSIICSLLISTMIGCGGIPFVEREKQMGIFNGKTIHVYPVHVLEATSSFDSETANEVAGFVNGTDGLKAVYINQTPVVNSEWGMNEANMFSKSFYAFADFVKQTNPTMDYALLVEILGQPQSVGGVHYYLLDVKESKAVMAHIINSHNKDFQTVNPKSTEDAIKVFELVFMKDLKKLKSGE